ncbi:hypothetical protein BV898_18373 [Hypsibius exemplaris]|uniref:G-protein coupled receptors family 1 profile domain-containing protein n=1 Tax=Hypsibius exemplaris TaxID=2072580 RepID=A0A9X6NQ52_HYPEX|nr:hypothetical protein BV898_18373 [Hypsibius exemplaris]
MPEALVNNTFFICNLTLENATFLNVTSPSVNFHWSPMAVFNTSNLCIGLLGNSLLLILLVTDNRLRTPFNLYVIGLACANLLSLTYIPFTILSNLTGEVWIAGEAACSYFLYLNWVECSTIYYHHLLVAVNRVWAIIHPVSYRTRHTKRLAQCLIVVVWAFTHAIMLPFWALDTLFHRRTIAQNGFACLANDREQYAYSVVAQVILYLLPIFVQILVFPVVYFARKARTMQRAMVAPVDAEPQRASLPCSQSIGTVQSTVAVTEASRSLNREQSTRPIAPGAVRARRKNRSGLVLLALMSLCALVSWAPITYWSFVGTLSQDLVLPEHAWDIFMALAAIQASADPIIFLFSLGKLRDAVWRLAHRFIDRFRPQ